MAEEVPHLLGSGAEPADPSFEVLDDGRLPGLHRTLSLGPDRNLGQILDQSLEDALGVRESLYRVTIRGSDPDSGGRRDNDDGPTAYVLGQ